MDQEPRDLHATSPAGQERLSLPKRLACIESSAAQLAEAVRPRRLAALLREAGARPLRCTTLFFGGRAGALWYGIFWAEGVRS